MKKTPFDNIIGHFDAALRVCAGSVGQTQRPSPATNISSEVLDQDQRTESARLMRINHCGEVCAQALYHGQALTAKSPRTVNAMKKAADEETDHLSWCESRIKQLDSHVSYLNPFWYGASFVMGAATGLLGDKVNLGFVAATEEQVCKHIEDHLERLPEQDHESRAILEQMKIDEGEHEQMALEAGGAKYPAPVKAVMTAVSKVMTGTTYWV